MGMLIEGHWTDRWYDPDEEGRFVRPPTRFRRFITDDGSTPFAPEAGRYHLYVSLACPWAHRTLVTRALLGLEDAISVSVVDPLMGDDGWEFDDGSPDHLFGKNYLREVYVQADAEYTGRVTVPVLWDRRRGTIVNNESREIMRMMNTALLPLATTGFRLLPDDTAAVDEAIDAVYEPINNGVYRSGFATTQEAYEEAVTELFDALDHWDGVLAGRRFMVGDTMTEADVCLFTTLLRFDVVYHGHFKCNVRRIADYEHLSRLLREVYGLPGVAATCDFDQIKRHYYWSHTSINPHRIVPVGPAQVFAEP